MGYFVLTRNEVSESDLAILFLFVLAAMQAGGMNLKKRNKGGI